MVAPFNPRRDQWEEHFTNIGGEIVGITEVGRATVVLLDMNQEERLIIRAQLQAEGLL